VSAIEISLIVFACVFGGALLGLFLHSVLPERHLSPESRQVVNLGMGIIGTMAALVLGLLVASAKGTYDTQGNELMDVSSKIILLDRVLALYGPETKATRAQLRSTVEGAVDRIWPQERRRNRPPQFDEPSPGVTDLYRQIAELSPINDNQRAIKAQAVALVASLTQTRWLVVVQQSITTSKPLLVILVFWLTINFISLGLFAPRNGTVIVTLFLCAIAVSGAILLIQELSTPFGGLIHLSSSPLRNALAHLGQ
jgi:hypothetical protein